MPDESWEKNNITVIDGFNPVDHSASIKINCDASSRKFSKLGGHDLAYCVRGSLFISMGDEFCQRSKYQALRRIYRNWIL